MFYIIQSYRHPFCWLQNEKRKQTPEQQTIKCIVLGDRSSGRPKLLEQLVKYSHPEGRQANIWQNLTQVSYSPDLLNRPAETGDTLILPPVLISRCRSPNGVPIVFYELEHRPFPSQDDDHIPLFPLVHRHTFDGEALYIVVFDLSRLAFTDIEPEIVKSEFERNIGHHLIQIQMYAPGSVVSLVGIVSSAHRIHDHQLFDKYPKSEKFVRKSLIVQPVSESEDETGSTPSSVTPRDRFSLNEFLMDLANDYVREHVNRTGVENLIPIKILSPVKTMALGLVHTSSGDETFIGIHTPGEFWDDLEKRIYSPLFAHRRYKVPQSWNNLAESLCRDYSEKLLVRVILDNSETPGGPQSLFDQTDVITIKDLNAYGVTEVESCMRHCHTSGYLVWIREHYVLKNTIILQPTSFFRTLSGILCPLTAIIPPVCEAGCGRTDYLQHLTGLNQEQLSTSLQILRAHGTLDHKLLRAILPSVKRGDRTIGEGKSHSDRSARSTHKSRSRHPVKRSSRSTNKSSTRSSRWRPYPSRGKPWNLINPNRAVNDITPSHVANRTIVWLSELFQVGFAPQSHLTHCDRENSPLHKPHLIFPHVGRSQHMNLRLLHATCTDTAHEPMATRSIEIWFHFATPPDFATRLRSTLGANFSMNLAGVCFTNGNLAKLATKLMGRDFTSIRLDSTLKFLHPQFTIYVQELTSCSTKGDLIQGIRLACRFTREEIQFDLPEGYEKENDQDPLVIFNPLEWTLYFCRQVKTETRELTLDIDTTNCF